jgi:ureidoglycolate hydrolase
MAIKSQPLTVEKFERFGKVVSLPKQKPTSEDKTYKFWSDIANYHIEGKTEIGLCTVYQQEVTIINNLEKHIDTPEILFPVDAPFILPLQKEGDGSPEAFTVIPGEAVVIESGVWHGACIPVGVSECTYFVIFKQDTPQTDVFIKDIEPVEITG